MQHQITKPSKLLNKCGELIQKGYAVFPLLKFCRKYVAQKSRLKEWDYYLINNDQYAVTMTVGKSSSVVLISVSVIDFTTQSVTGKTTVKILSEKKFTMPESSETGDIIIQDRKMDLSFRHVNENRKLYFSMKGILPKNNMELSFLLTKEPQDSMVIATPFNEDKKMFYYNRKIIGMSAIGFVKLENRSSIFDHSNSFGLLDWGRGVWPYHTTWYWSAAQGKINCNLFGFNLGYGFGDTSAATENMLFYNGVASKLEQVTFHIPKSWNEYDYMKPWKITSSDGRFTMVFTPILDRSTNLSILLLSTNQHQVFGTFSGTATLDDGSIILLKNFLGFAERVENKW